MSVKETTIIYSGYFPPNLLHKAPPGVQLIPLESSLGGLREQVQGYILGGDETLTKRDFDQFPQLRCATFVGTGVESFIDIEEADRRGITVLNTPGLNGSAVAEYCFMVALASRRRLLANVTRPDRAPVVGRALTAHSAATSSILQPAWSSQCRRTRSDPWAAAVVAGSSPMGWVRYSPEVTSRVTV